MRALLRLTVLGSGLAFALIAGVAPARAGFDTSMIGTATYAGGGLTLFSYAITDLGTSTDNIGEFSLAVPVNANINVMSIAAPSGFFVDYTPGNLFLSFDSTDPSTDLRPGQSATFSFLSANLPGQSSYTLLDYNNFRTSMGSIVAPGAVPEPGSVVLLGLGLSFAGAMLVRRRSRDLTSLAAPPA